MKRSETKKAVKDFKVDAPRCVIGPAVVFGVGHFVFPPLRPELEAKLRTNHFLLQAHLEAQLLRLLQRPFC